MRLRTFVVVILLAMTPGLASAADAPSAPAPVPPAAPAPAPNPPQPPTSEEAADAVLAVIAAKDDAGLQALAAKDAPDPWIVADELVRRGAFDAADAFARAAPRADVEALPAYVASRRGKPDDPAQRERLAKANVAVAAKKPADALEALGSQDPTPIEDVVGVRIAMGRGSVLSSLGRLEASSTAFLAAGEVAERLGWLGLASRASHEGGAVAFRGSVFVAARAAWDRALAVCERRGDRVGVAKTRGNIGLVQATLGDYTGALATYERVMTEMEALGDKAGVARALGNIGVVHKARGEYAKALAIYERVLAVREALGDEAGVASTLGHIGAAHTSLGDYEKAMEMLERAWKAKVALGDRAGAAATLAGIGNVHFALGDNAKALEIYERVLAAMKDLGDKAGEAATLSNIGSVYASLGDFPKALAIYERTLAAQEALGIKSKVAGTLGNIGAIHKSLGDYARALAMHDRALAAMEALGDKAGVAAALGNMGLVHYALGDHAKALALYERAMATQDALGMKAEAASTMSSIGSVHNALGDYAKALVFHQRAWATQAAMGRKRSEAMTLGNIGNVHYALGDYPKALATLERALVAKEAVGDKVGAATTLGNIGAIHRALGDFAKALPILDRAMAAQEALGDRAAAAATLIHIGDVSLALGDSTKAIKAFERASRMAEKLGSTRMLASALFNLAAARLRSGDAGRALSDAHRAVLLLKTLVGGLGEEQGATSRAQFTVLFSTGLAAAAKLNDPSEAAFFLESGRAGTMLESLDARDALRHAALPEELRVAEATARAGEARARVAYTKTLDGDDLAAIRARDEDLKAAQAKVQEVVERIQRDAKREARLWYPVASPVEDLQGFLAPADALVLYGLAEKDDLAHALVLTRDDARIVPLGATSALVAACEALEANDASSDPEAALSKLRDLLVKPLGLPAGTKRLLVSPEGPLSYVPFAALVPDLVVAYQASGTTYGVLLEEKDKRGAQVLAVADPDYAVEYAPISLDLYAPQALAATGTTRGGRLVPLPGTRAEATAVADVKLFGKEASEGGLRAALAAKKARWHAVHFACHGLVSPDRPALSSLALTPDGEDDGFLTALEVLKMEIPSDLVVLSACETGKGKIVGGEGIVGLTRAFMYAGSPRVICSLWKVDDAATSALMTKFYELWNPKDGTPGLATAEALRQAQAFVKSQEKWKHPYYWAAWVLWGLPS